MDKLTPSERFNAASIAFDEGAFGSMDQAASFISLAESHAKALHTLYTRECNRQLTERETTAIERHESALKHAFELHRVGLYLNTDPRGNPVGILTPKTGKYNTMGGAEAGWRL